MASHGPSRSKRETAALLGALLVHALAFALALRPDEPTPARHPVTVELRVVDHASDQRDAVPPRKLAVPGPRPRHDRIARTPIDRASEPSPLPSAEPVAPTQGAENGPIGNEAESARDSSGGTPAVELFPSGALAEGNARWRAAQGDTGSGEEPQGDDEASTRARVTARIGRDVETFQAKDRVAVGLIDPYFHDLRDGMKQRWAPSASDLGGADGDGLGANLKNLLAGWNAAGGQWARTGSPYEDGEGPEAEVARSELQRAAGGTSGFDGNDFRNRWNTGEFAAPGGSVVVSLTQRTNGEPLKVEVLVSSGLRALDETALAAIREAAMGREAPAHGLGLGGRVIRSTWKLEAKYVTQTCAITPDPTGGLASGLLNQGSGIVPGLACGGTMDLGSGTVDPQTPLTTRIITKITLLAVYGGERTRAE